MLRLHHAGDVRAVDGGENSFRARQGASSFAGQHDAGHSRDVAEENDARARRDGVVEKIQHLRARLSPGLGSVIFFTTMP